MGCDPLEARLLLRRDRLPPQDVVERRPVEHDVINAQRAIVADVLIERIKGGKRVRHGAVGQDRPAERRRVTPMRVAMLVEPRTQVLGCANGFQQGHALPRIFRLWIRLATQAVPTVSIARCDAKTAIAMCCKNEWWTGALYWRRHCRTFAAIVVARLGDGLAPQEVGEDNHLLFEAGEALAGRPWIQAEGRVVVWRAAGAKPELTPARREMVEGDGLCR